jgi:FKBP-type peptidyl-prolyl cis-trans isomerase 2
VSDSERISEGARVELAYRLLDQDGNVVESSEEAGPMEFIVGSGDVFPALEQALIGLSEGDERAVQLEPEEAFGEVDLEAVFAVPLDALPEGTVPSVGDVVPIMLEPEEGEDPDGEGAEEYEALVREVNADGVVLDTNHPLAGHTLTFEIKVLRVRG